MSPNVPGAFGVSGLQIVGGVMKGLAAAAKEGYNYSKYYMLASRETWKARREALQDESTMVGALVAVGKRGFKFFKGLGSALLDVFGVFMQFAQATGVVEPIMQLLNAVMQLIGASAMQTLIPALQSFAETLFSPESMELWKQLGIVVGQFFSTILNYFTELLKTEEGREFLLRTITGIVNLLLWVGKALGTFFAILTMIPPNVLGAILYGFALFFAFMQGMIFGGIAGFVLGAIFATVAGIVLAPLLTLQTGGIVTRPTQAVIGEGGEPEAVVPLSQAGSMGFGGGKDLLYATQDTNDKLDMIIFEMQRGRRLR